MRCEDCERACDEAELFKTLQDERETLADSLRREAAQTLASVLVHLGTVLKLEDLGDIRKEITDLRDAVRPELDLLLRLVAGLDQRRQASCLLPPNPSVCWPAAQLEG
jgi:hypothetical protein